MPQRSVWLQTKSTAGDEPRVFSGKVAAAQALGPRGAPALGAGDSPLALGAAEAAEAAPGSVSDDGAGGSATVAVFSSAARAAADGDAGVRDGAFAATPLGPSFAGTRCRKLPKRSPATAEAST